MLKFCSSEFFSAVDQQTMHTTTMHQTLKCAEVRLSRLLRVLAVLDLLALIAVVLPGEMMGAVHAWLGLGPLEIQPMMLYLARTVSLLYAFQGATLWHLASDVLGYRRLIRLWGQLTLLGVVVFMAIDLSAGLPWWWCLGEAVCLALIGGSLLWAERQLSQAATAHAPRREMQAVNIGESTELAS